MISRNINIPSILLYCVIPLRFVIEWMPLIGLPLISTSIVVIEYISLLICYVHLIKQRSLLCFNILTRLCILFFLIYSGYILYDIIINPQIPRIDMSHTPKTNLELYQGMFTYLSVFLLTNYFNKKIDYNKWAKFSCLILTVTLVIYSIRTDLSLYAYSRIISFKEFNPSEYGLLDGLRLGWFCGITFICNLYCRKMWTNKIIINNFIFVIISIISIGITMATTQRGPIIFVITTTIFYYYAIGGINKKYIINIILISLISFIFIDNIILFLNTFFPEFIIRFADIFEGGSGRYGTSDSAYSIALNEIMMNPIWGHYFRYTTVNDVFYGSYPHNIFLELFMTMGIVISIPFIVVIFKCVQKTFYALRNKDSIAVLGLIFVYILSTLLTSGSMLNLGIFWIPMIIISSYKSQKLPQK